MTKLEELKALMREELLAMQKYSSVMWDNEFSDDEKNTFLCAGLRQKKLLEVAALEFLPALLAIAEAAQKVVRHETGSFDLLTDAVREIDK